MSTQELRERLAAVLAAGPPLRLAVLFGSVARGAEHAGSDVDVAVWPVDTSVTLAVELQLAAALEAAVGRRVDVVRLDTADPELAWRVARDGVPLAEARPGEFARFSAEAAITHADFEETAAPARARYLRRVAERAR